MSRAVDAGMPVSGIAVPGSTPCGSVIQRSRLGGVFGSSPAITARRLQPASGGPTVGSKAPAPGIVWQVRQP
jgi:hypothetical protein